MGCSSFSPAPLFFFSHSRLSALKAVFTVLIKSGFLHYCFLPCGYQLPLPQVHWPKTHCYISSVPFTLLIKKPVPVTRALGILSLCSDTPHSIVFQTAEPYAAIMGQKSNVYIAMAIRTPILSVSMSLAGPSPTAHF